MLIIRFKEPISIGKSRRSILELEWDSDIEQYEIIADQVRGESNVLKVSASQKELQQIRTLFSQTVNPEGYTICTIPFNKSTTHWYGDIATTILLNILERKSIVV